MKNIFLTFCMILFISPLFSQQTEIELQDKDNKSSDYIYMSITTLKELIDENEKELDVEETETIELPSIVPYVASGISITNSANFADSAYLSVEGGLMYENVAGAIVFGRNNISGLLSDGDGIYDYWTELKFQISHSIGFVDVYGLFGGGIIFTNNRSFIEYGAGVSKELVDGFGVFLQVSNWDNVNYITPGAFIKL